MSASTSSCISRRLTIGGGQVIVLDGLFSADLTRSVYAFLRTLPYRLTETDTDEAAYAPHWTAELPVAMAAAKPLFQHCIQLTTELMSSTAITLRRVHANLHMYGDMQFPHTDLAGGVTALYYANPYWNEEWLGETIIYDEHREPAYAVAPKPGRLVVFHADIVHRGGVPSRECHEPRISVAFKFVSAPPRP